MGYFEHGVQYIAQLVTELNTFSFQFIFARAVIFVNSGTVTRKLNAL